MFGQTWRETESLQVLLGCFWVYSPACAFSLFSWEGSLCLYSFYSLQPTFCEELSLSSSFFRSDRTLSRLGATFDRFDSLPSHVQMIWTDGSVPFSLVKSSSRVLTNCSRCGDEATISFSAYSVQVFLVKSTLICKLYACLGSTNKSATSSLLLLDSHTVLSYVFPFT